MTTTSAPTTSTETMQLSAVLQRVVEAMEAQGLQQQILWQQTEALTSLLTLLKPDAPFPQTRGWAASPDFLMLIAQAIYAQGPCNVAEASSGVSTLTCAYCLKRLGGGHVTSLEHDEEYAKKTRAMLDMHGLSEWATVLHAPLVQMDIAGHAMPWYDPEVIKTIPAIDVLVVDGPPGRTSPLARFPALPRLESLITPGAIILADDGGRPAEKEMVKRWCAMYPNLTSEYHPTEKGAFMLRWPKS